VGPRRPLNAVVRHPVVIPAVPLAAAILIATF